MQHREFNKHIGCDVRRSRKLKRKADLKGKMEFNSVCLPGISVPIMLAYVYGVVPISLCRGGGCGVSRGKGRGVRIDFDEDDGPITGENRDIHRQF